MVNLFNNLFPLAILDIRKVAWEIAGFELAVNMIVNVCIKIWVLCIFCKYNRTIDYQMNISYGHFI